MDTVENIVVGGAGCRCRRREDHPPYSFKALKEREIVRRRVADAARVAYFGNKPDKHLLTPVQRWFGKYPEKNSTYKKQIRKELDGLRTLSQQGKPQGKPKKESDIAVLRRDAAGMIP